MKWGLTHRNDTVHSCPYNGPFCTVAEEKYLKSKRTAQLLEDLGFSGSWAVLLLFKYFSSATVQKGPL